MLKSLEGLASDKLTNLLSLIISCEEYEGRIHNTLFSGDLWAQKARVLYNNSLEGLARDKHSSLFGQITSCEENKGRICNTLFSS